jgi:drug/metabolite transporter (DMT)-like permease
MVALGSYQVALLRFARVAYLAQHLEPVAAILPARLLLGETFAGVQWGAAGLTLLGLRRLTRESVNS